MWHLGQQVSWAKGAVSVLRDTVANFELQSTAVTGILTLEGAQQVRQSP